MISTANSTEHQNLWSINCASSQNHCLFAINLFPSARIHLILGGKKFDLPKNVVLWKMIKFFNLANSTPIARYPWKSTRVHVIPLVVNKFGRSRICVELIVKFSNFDWIFFNNLTFSNSKNNNNINKINNKIYWFQICLCRTPSPSVLDGHVHPTNALLP